MKVVYTEEALKDLDEIADWLIVHDPAIAPAVELRIRSVVSNIGRWPEIARRSAGRAGVRVLPIGKYPYKSFYRIAEQSRDSAYPSCGSAPLG
jgi:toxin ParE1/3/4